MRKRLRRIIYLLLSILVVANVLFAVFMSRSIARDQGVTTLRESIIDAALQCCAVEGSYPASLKHLEEHYGLTVNESDYIVSYEWLGDNVPPSVVVKVR